MREKGYIVPVGGSDAAGGRLRSKGWMANTVTAGSARLPGYSKNGAVIAFHPGEDLATMPLLWTAFGPVGAAPEPEWSEGINALCDSSPGGSMDFSRKG